MSSEYKIPDELDFTSEVTLSNQLNLHASLTSIKSVMSFSTLVQRENNDMITLLHSSDPNAPDSSMEQEIAKIEHALSSTNPRDINELKSFTAPPAAIKNVANAFCLLFAMKPEYINFKKIVADPNYMKKILNYDRSNVSDYVIVKLKAYVDMPEFSPEYIVRISGIAAVLCQWVHFIYSYSIKVF